MKMVVIGNGSSVLNYEYGELIGKYLGRLGQLDGVVAPKEGFEPQL